LGAVVGIVIFAWLAPETFRLVLGLTFAIGAGVLAGWIVQPWASAAAPDWGPYRLPINLPPDLELPAQVASLQRLFLGFARARGRRGDAVFAAAKETDSCGVVGPSQVGKTTGILIPQVLLWAGGVISTSTKPDILRATAGRRLQVASETGGGQVYLYAPTSFGHRLEGLQPIRWSPLAGCQEPTVAYQRVEGLLASSATGRHVENADHWRAGAGRILRPYFLAAAHHAIRPGDFTVVREWLAEREFDEPLEILASLGSFAADQWITELRGVQGTPEREQGSFFSAASTAVAATSNPNVLRSCTGTDLNPVEFLTSGSTLYVVSPTEDQEAVAPLLSALIEYLVSVAYDLHRQGRLPLRLLLSLDELPNIAPLPRLDAILSQGAGQGVNVSWAAQSQAQLRERYGEDGAEAIWSGTSAKQVFGGLADGPALDRLSRLLGEHRVPTRSTSSAFGLGSYVSRGWEWRPRLSPAEIHGMPPEWVLLVYRESGPMALWAPIVPKQPVWAPALLPWPAPPETQAAAWLTAESKHT
jgi:type IV secretory pathway TraG/TraD family ATPase VirD4